jgi:threonine dehydrogenase-like Zn-dependent dehydrogenase
MAVDLCRRGDHFCQALGAGRTVILGEQNLSEEVRAWTDGYGVDAAVICTPRLKPTPRLNRQPRRAATADNWSMSALRRSNSLETFQRKGIGG